MGVTGLLPLLKPIIKSSNIRQFHHRRVAVDTYSWIHKSLYGVLDELILNPDTTKWIHYCLRYLDLLLSQDMDVILVFDGANLPAKAKTESSRALSRSKNLNLGLESLQKGETSNSRTYLAKSVDVTPRMAAQLIQICQRCRPNVKCVVAPYEADAQLAYLSRNNLVDLIVTEDSDCIPYLCKEVGHSPLSLSLSLCLSVCLTHSDHLQVGSSEW
jgi:exonuclease 1